MKIVHAVELRFYNGPIEFVGFTELQIEGSDFTYYKTVYGFVTEETMDTDGPWEYDCYFPVDIITEPHNASLFKVNEDDIEWSRK